MLYKKSKSKVFCIGQNKTGTTSFETALKDFGYKMGNQVKGELLFSAWHQRDFKKILDFCKTAEAFQDIPFSLPYNFQPLVVFFTDAKFILKECDSVPNEADLTKFYSKLWANVNKYQLLQI